MMQFTSTGSPARYLASMKPILDQATATRAGWLQSLTKLSRAQDLGPLSNEAAQDAVRTREQFNEARRALGNLRPPPAYDSMGKALDQWLESLALSCDAIASAPPPLTPEIVQASRLRLRDAAQHAGQFNAERSSIVTVGGEPPPSEEEPPSDGDAKGGTRNLIIIGLVVLVLISVASYLFLGIGGTAVSPRQATAIAAAATATAFAGIPTPTRKETRTYPQAEIVDRLKREILSRAVAFRDADVRLIPPDRVIVAGKVQGPANLIPVEVELQIGVTDAGKPKMTAVRLTAVGVQVPPEANDALAKRAEEGTRLLAEQFAPDQFLRRLYIDNNAIVAELDSVAPSTVPPIPGAPASSGVPKTP